MYSVYSHPSVNLVYSVYSVYSVHSVYSVYRVYGVSCVHCRISLYSMYSVNSAYRLDHAYCVYTVQCVELNYVYFMNFLSMCTACSVAHRVPSQVMFTAAPVLYLAVGGHISQLL